MQWRWCLGIILISLLYCEFLGDYIKLYDCSWPAGNEKETLQALILADTHLLGPFRGHWLDKFYREWHMYRSFQAAMALFKPHIVFVLGDLFDEGDIVNAQQFHDYVQRFARNFRAPAGTPIVSAVGNHDIGFHYKFQTYLTSRFEEHFNNTGVNLYTFKGIHFVFINSMALENDGCYFCESALEQLNQVASKINCLRNAETCKNQTTLLNHPQRTFSRPILMQHFPTYRISDKFCKESDSPVMERYRENWEVLSKTSTKLLGQLIQPRAAFAGHSHHYCLNINSWGIKEYTVASFSWRNKVNPSFLLAVFTTSKQAVTKCDMLQQQTVYNSYMLAAITCISLAFLKYFKSLYRYCLGKFSKNMHKNK